jgi:hypothetical protein
VLVKKTVDIERAPSSESKENGGERQKTAKKRVQPRVAENGFYRRRFAVLRVRTKRAKSKI